MSKEEPLKVNNYKKFNNKRFASEKFSKLTYSSNTGNEEMREFYAIDWGNPFIKINVLKESAGSRENYS